MSLDATALEFQDQDGCLEVRALGDSTLARMKSQLQQAVAEVRARKAKVEQIDRENFTSRVATNRGQPAPVFNNRKDAVNWILGRPPSPTRA